MVSSAQVDVPIPDSGDPPRSQRKLTPCSPGDPGAKEMTWNDIGSDELLEPPLYVFCPAFSPFLSSAVAQGWRGH